MQSGLVVGFADGLRWTIRPIDDEAAAAVTKLGRAMRLKPGQRGRELYVATCDTAADALSTRPDGAVVCHIPKAADWEGQIRQMEHIAFVLAREALLADGLLFHGALAEYKGGGFVMGGPSRVGKSTASRRLPPPWRAMSDDTTLVVRDRTGRFWAHPWPTWSRLRYEDPNLSWPVEYAVPLKVMFFLDQSPEDGLERISITQTTALVMDSAEELSLRLLLTPDVSTPAARVLLHKTLRAAKSLATALPAYTLRISLEGRFWEVIEGVLPKGDSSLPDGGPDDHSSPAAEPLAAQLSQHVLCTGFSMHPTLGEADLLELEPYDKERPVRPGDVVCFKEPDTQKTVVHRVVAVGPEGIRTRGDNNPTDDHWLLQPGDLTGRVKFAQRGARRRAVPGGRHGLVIASRARLRRMVRARVGVVPRMLYRLLGVLQPIGRLLPASYRPRPVRFGTMYRVFPKLLMGRRAVGHYDLGRGRWQVRLPFRPFVDEQTLRRADLYSFPYSQDQN